MAMQLIEMIAFFNGIDRPPLFTRVHIHARIADTLEMAVPDAVYTGCFTKAICSKGHLS